MYFAMTGNFIPEISTRLANSIRWVTIAAELLTPRTNIASINDNTECRNIV